MLTLKMRFQCFFISSFFSAHQEIKSGNKTNNAKIRSNVSSSFEKKLETFHGWSTKVVIKEH